MPCHPMITRRKAEIFKPNKLFFMSKHPLPLAEESICASKAWQCHKWKQAMFKEFTTLMTNGTWSLVPNQPHFNIIGNKYVFHLKRNLDGSIPHHKAWLVAKGFHQQPSIDYKDTFSPVIVTSLKFDVSMAPHHGTSHGDTSHNSLVG